MLLKSLYNKNSNTLKWSQKYLQIKRYLVWNIKLYITNPKLFQKYTLCINKKKKKTQKDSQLMRKDSK